MGNETIQDTSFFNEKREKQGKKLKNRRKNTKKQGEKTGKNQKLQEIQKRDFDEVSGNAERSSQMSQNNDSRAKTMYRPTPTRLVKLFVRNIVNMDKGHYPLQ